MVKWIIFNMAAERKHSLLFTVVKKQADMPHFSLRLNVFVVNI
jgi:hypothetical protein